MIHDVGMRILGRAQNKLVPVKHIDKAGIALHGIGNQFDDAFEHGVKRIGRRHAAANLVQQINLIQSGRSLFLLGQGPPSLHTTRSRSIRDEQRLRCLEELHRATRGDDLRTPNRYCVTRGDEEKIRK